VAARIAARVESFMGFLELGDATTATACPSPDPEIRRFVSRSATDFVNERHS
jgi:hypothetical protein